MNTWLFYVADILTLFVMQRTLLASYPKHKQWVKAPRTCQAGCFCVLVLTYLLVSRLHTATFLINTLLYAGILAVYALFFLATDFFVCLSQIALFTSIKATLPALFSGVVDLLEKQATLLESVERLFPGDSGYGVTSLSYDFATRLLPSVCMIGFYFYLTRFATKGEERIPVSYWLTMLFTSVATIAWGTYSYPEYFAEEYATQIRAMVSLGFLIINLMVYYLFYRITLQYQENLELKVLQQRISLDKSANEDMNRLYLDLRQVRHDLLNHIGIMDSLLKEKHYQELENYFQSLQQKEYHTLHTLETGNVAVNALLNRKVSEIKSLGIPVHTKVVVPPKSSIADMDLCAIFANLLDNASEAVQNTGHGSIELTALPRTGYLTIQSANTVDEDPLEKNPHLHSTKEASPFHGLGLKIIRNLVEDYDGMLSMHTEDQKFCVDIMLPLTESNTLM